MPALVEAEIKQTKEPEMTTRTQQSERANLSKHREIKKVQKPHGCEYPENDLHSFWSENAI
jgi:hypothetical protein